MNLFCRLADGLFPFRTGWLLSVFLEDKMKKDTIALSDHFTYKRLIRFTLPTIAMMIFTSIYGVVDGYFISNYVGKTPFAAINLIMPFIMIVGGTGFMIGTGGTALTAKILGEGNPKEANNCFSMMTLFAAALGVALSILGIVFMRPVSVLLGATEDMLRDCMTYGNLMMAFNVLFMLQNLFQTFLVAAEKPKLGLAATIAAGCTNMALDALFVGVFHWGVAGAAWATGISQLVGTVIPMIYFISSKKSPLRLRWVRLRIRPILSACANGSSELMSNISGSVVAMLYNFQLLRFAGEDGVSAYGVIMYVLFIFVALYVGYAVGVSPIVSYHYGAKNTDELKSLLRKSCVLMTITGVCMTVAAVLLSPPLAKLYVGYDADLYALTNHAMRIYSVHFVLTGLNIFASSFFTALNNGGVSAAISFLRTLIFQAASVLLLPMVLGADGIWWAVTVAEVFAFIISVCFLIGKRKQYNYF